MELVSYKGDFGMRKNRIGKQIGSVLVAAMLLAGCGNAPLVQEGTPESLEVEMHEEQMVNTSGEVAIGAANQVTLLDENNQFSDRDLEQGYVASKCVQIDLSNPVKAESESVEVTQNVITIKAAGSYLLSGELQGQLIVDAGSDDKIQLVLDGAAISCESSAALYVKKADKVFVTTAAGSQNLLETVSEYVAIDEHNIDGAVFSRKDITFNGKGSLEVISTTGNGIVCKDDLAVTGGNYVITAGSHGLQGKDSIRIVDGTLDIKSGKDGIHSGNDEDDTVGYTYIAGGTILIQAEDDGIHSDTQLVIAGGTVEIQKSYEGLEGAEIEIAGGHIFVVAADDGLNAAGGSDGNSREFFGSNDKNYIIISGGVLQVNAQGDGIDSNGNLYVNGGEVVVNGPTNGGNGALDYGGNGYIYGGSVIAIGASGMAVNFAKESGQCAIMVTTESQMEAGTKVTLKDGNGKILLTATAKKTFNNVVFSCPEITIGESYTAEIGDESVIVEMTETIYGDGSGMGGFGGKGNRDGERPNGGNRGEMPEGFNPGERPEGFKRGERPERFDTSQMP